MRLCFVIQRYGLEVAGGSELHCRWLAGRLARRHQVEVATTCALDYLEWRDHYAPGPDRVEDIPVTRYPVTRPRSERRFALVSDLVFHEEHSLADEREWVVENGPFSPELVRSLPRRRDVDLFVFYSYRYYQTFFGLPPVASQARLASSPITSACTPSGPKRRRWSSWGSRRWRFPSTRRSSTSASSARRRSSRSWPDARCW